jgi:PrcB C-terminal
MSTAFSIRLMAVLAACLVASCSAVAIGKEGRAIKILKSESFAICPDGSSEQNSQLLVSATDWRLFVGKVPSSTQSLTQWNPDFSRTSIAVLRIGSRPSTGYALSVVEARALQRDDSDQTLILTVQSNSPAPGALSSSIITTPCVVVEVEAVGFKTLKVL